MLVGWQRFKGIHRLPVLLRISQGKQFWLVLEGRTVDLNTPFLYPLVGTDGPRPTVTPALARRAC